MSGNRSRPPLPRRAVARLVRRGRFARPAAAAPLGLAVALALAALPASADVDKLLLTGGVTTVEGAAGGGLTPWAVIGSNATEGEIGATATVSDVATKTYNMQVLGAAVGIHDRVELSIAHQDFDTGSTGKALGLPGLHLKMDTIGVKLKLAGDAVLDSDSPMPQIAVGAQLKGLDAGDLKSTLESLGAHTHGTDFYVSATKLFLAQGILVNGTLRLTKANQIGLLGFGGTAHEGYSLQPEFSVAWLASKSLAFGAEYRFKPDNLNPSALGAGLKEDNWADAFVAWAPNKHLSLTAAYVDLGHVVPAVATQRQRGGYASAQIAF